MSTERQIASAIVEVGLKSDQFTKLDAEKSRLVIQTVQQHFVNTTDTRWWWEDFRVGGCVLRFKKDEAYRALPELAPLTDQTLWFIAKDSLEDQVNFLVYQPMGVNLVSSVLAQCSHFEYYVIPSNFDWLICENHHGFLFGLGRATDQFQNFAKNHSDEILSLRALSE